MGAALARHDALVRGAIEAHQGYVCHGWAGVRDRVPPSPRRGDDRPGGAGGLDVEPWPEEAVLRVRMGGHTRVVPERGWKYFGPAVNVAARIMAAGHCGHVLMSAVTAGLVGNTGPRRRAHPRRAGRIRARLPGGAGTFPPAVVARDCAGRALGIHRPPPRAGHNRRRARASSPASRAGQTPCTPPIWLRSPESSVSPDETRHGGDGRDTAGSRRTRS
jgi:hypothetical protein